MTTAKRTTAADAGAGSFIGFRREAIQFLADLAANNDRSWFQPRKREYEVLLKEPMEALCVALADRFAARGLPLVADPARSPFRIYRDVRFSRDKSPYKTNLAVSFPWAEAGSAAPGAPHGAHGVGAYFNFQPGEMYAGGGMWRPQPVRLAAWRSAVDRDPERVHAALNDPGFRARFGTVGGDSLKRVPTGFAPDHPDATLLRLKDVVFGQRLSDEEALSSGLPDILVDAFGAAAPVLRLLAALDS